MKIESMDAASVQPMKIQSMKQHTDPINTNTNPKTETKDQSNVKDLKNQLTEYDKNELSVSDKAVVEAIEKANKAITGAKTQFEFSIHEKTKEIMVKVIDSETQEIIREIPPEKILDMVAKMWEMAGIMVDERR